VLAKLAHKTTHVSHTGHRGYDKVVGKAARLTNIERNGVLTLVITQVLGNVTYTRFIL